MNKKDFKNLIQQELVGKSVERQIEFLLKIKNVWIDEMIFAIKKKNNLEVPEEKKKEYWRCNKCQKYTLLKKTKSEYKREIFQETTYRDAGYGDDDREGLVERLVHYVTCPHCGNKQVIKKDYLRTLQEWNRKEGRK